MIELYSGTPGSGKSMDLTRRIYDRVKCSDTLTVLNYKLNEKRMGRCRGKLICTQNEVIDVEFLQWLSDWYFAKKKFREGRILLVIDEAQRVFNSRDWNSSVRRAWLTFFAEHRHWGIDVILVAQFDKMLDAQIRALIENEIIHRKVNNAGFAGKVIGLLGGGTVFATCEMWYPMKLRTGGRIFRYKRKYAKLYDSYARKY